MVRGRALQDIDRIRIRALGLTGEPEDPTSPATNEADEELVRGLLAGEPEAAKRFTDSYKAIFQHCVAQFESNATSREDLFQNLIFHVLERLRQGAFDASKGSFGTWLYRVAWCRSVDLKRKENARRRVPVQNTDDDLTEKADPTPGPERQVGDEELGSAVRSALEELEPEERELLVLRFVDGLTLVEVAERVGLSVEQTKYRLKRASAALRKALIARLPREEVLE